MATKTKDQPTEAGTTKAAPATHPCACGCGTLVTRTFDRGHDSKLGKSLRAAYDSGQMTRAQVMKRATAISPRFVGKMERSMARVDEAKAATAKAAAMAKAPTT